MVYGGTDKNIVKTKCEQCEQWIEVDKTVSHYGPDEVSWYGGEYRKKLHTFCSEYCKNIWTVGNK